MSQLVCHGITKSYGDKEVLHGIDLTLESGKIYGLIGRNGAGKTTLLSILSNQNPATAGAVTLDQEPVWENRKALDRLCFSRELNISSESGLGNYRVKDYLRAAATYYTHWDRDLEKNLMTTFGVDAKKRLNKLSKGMLSMVTIIVALASKAEFTLLDEPVAGLDVVAREQFYRLLLQEYTQTGRTFVISTHIIEEAADLLEEVIILDQGRVIRKENTQELVGRAFQVTGLAEQVEAAIGNLETHHKESLGRSESVMVFLQKGQSIPEGYEITVQPVNLQKVFVALCGGETQI